MTTPNKFNKLPSNTQQFPTPRTTERFKRSLSPTIKPEFGMMMMIILIYLKKIYKN
jgi:hypothetical protein